MTQPTRIVLTSGTILLALLVACATQTMEPQPSPSSTPQLGETGGSDELVSALREAGATVEPAQEVTQSFFAVPGQIIELNGSPVQVFEYTDAEARKADSDLISPDGYTIGTSIGAWVDQPNFWAQGRLIVLYVGSDLATTDLLASVLGEPITVGDQAAIYASVIRQLYTVDHTFNEPPNFPVVYLVTATDDTIGDPDATQSAPHILSASVRSAISLYLQDLPAELVWVDSRSAVPLADDMCVAGDGAMIRLGNIHLEDSGLRLLSAELYVGPEAATGKTYVLERLEGIWQVVGDTGVQWIS